MTLNQKFQSIESELNQVFHERAQPINGISLSLLSGLNTLLLGPPGIAKSALVNTYARHIEEAKYFWWLLSRFSTPEELFGPYSMEGLKKDKFLRVTKGTLADCHIGFIDEIFKANSGVLNTLLPVLNERIFFNDRQPVKLNLLTVFGASNEIPEAEDNLEALYDRFPLKYKVIPIQEPSSFQKMMAQPDLKHYSPKTTVTLQDIYQARKELEEIPFPEKVLDDLTKVWSALQAAGLRVTERTFVQAKYLIRAQAWMKERSEVASADIEIMHHACWKKESEERTALMTVLDVISPNKWRIISIFNECEDIVNNIRKMKSYKKQMESAVEASGKIKDRRVEVEKLYKEMEARGQEVEDVRETLRKLERLANYLVTDILNMQIA